MTEKKYEFDLIVVGAGSAGIVGARFAAQLGARVALVEKSMVGGDCTWTGCVPSKALIHVAKVADAAAGASRYGIGIGMGTRVASLETDMRKVRGYIDQVIGDVYRQETPDVLRAEGVEVVQAPARFLNQHTIRAGGRSMTGKWFLLCTGAHPLLPQVPGLESVPYFTYERFFANEQSPEHLIVVGGGPVGLEVAQAYRRLGARVTVIARRLLSKEDPQVGLLLEKVLAGEGVDRVCGYATLFEKRGDTIIVRAGGQEDREGGEVRGDMLLVATGRTPTVDGLDLEKAGVAYSHKGIQVDEQLKTSVDHIFAAGDCTGGYQYTHYAGWQGFQAARNALLPGGSAGVTDVVPRVTYTDPEAGHVGYTEVEAREKFGDDVCITLRGMDMVDRAICEDRREGFIKAVYKKDGTLLGATVVAARAGEVLTEFVVALTRGMKIGDLAGPIHPYPTYSTPVQLIASGVAFDSFLGSLPGKVIRKLSGLSPADR